MELKAIETEYNGYKFRSRLEARWAVFFDALGVPYEYEPEGYYLGNNMYYLPDFRVKCYGTRGSRDGDPFDLYIEVKGKMSEADARKIHAFVYAPCDFEIICPCGYGEVKYSLSSDYDDGRHWECNCGCSICRDDENLSKPFKCRLDEKTTVGDPYYCGKIKNPVLVVGKIPERGGSYDSAIINPYARMDGTDIYPFNYETIDEDYYAAYPAAHKGKFYLWGDDGHYINDDDIAYVEAAYDAARQARFEHGEKPSK